MQRKKVHLLCKHPEKLQPVRKFFHSGFGHSAVFWYQQKRAAETDTKSRRKNTENFEGGHFV